MDLTRNLLAAIALSVPFAGCKDIETPAPPETVNVRGQVTWNIDKDNKYKPSQGAWVFVRRGDVWDSSKTNSEGRFFFNLSPRKYSFVSYNFSSGGVFHYGLKDTYVDKDSSDIGELRLFGALSPFP